jgi:transcriptional regulator with PAS, ATPase and Fis domain
MLDEFRVGHYAFKASEQTEKLEKEFHPLIESIDKVFGNVLKFDKLKETKIYTHHSRIRGLMNLMEEGAMIVDNSGDIIYINDKLQENYKFLDEDVNIFENVYDNHFEEYMKKYINEVISSQMKKEATRMPLKDSDDEITVKSTMYKNKSGDVLGAIFLVSGLKDVASNKQNLVKKIS